MARLLRQAGALAYLKRKGILRVLLISSRDTGRWVIPKGGIEPGFSARDAAAQEALVKVFPMKVDKQKKTWPEQYQRQIEWMPPEDAAQAVNEPELAAMIRQLDEAMSKTPIKSPA
jgi:hypothetical protein